MKFLLDMNLSPDWIPSFEEKGWVACHWSSVGMHDAPDTELLSWSRENGRIVVTQDLDFSQLLFTTADAGPSVVLVRMKDEFDLAGRLHVFRSITQAKDALLTGALLIISGNRARLRMLPIDPCR